MSDLTQWSYKRSHAITSATPLTNYQVKIRVYRTEGTSTGDTVYLGSKCLASYADIRFVASDGETELSYWLEVNAGTYADFWVKISSISTDTSIWVYYGNATASSMSNGDETFEFFDDFPGTSLDTTKWNTTYTGGTVSVSNSICTIYRSGAWQSIDSKSSFGTGYAVRYRFYVDAESNYWQSPWSPLNISGGSATILAAQWGAGQKYRTGNISATETTRSDSFASSNKTIEIQRIGSTSTRFYVNNVLKETHTTNIPTGNLCVGFAVNNRYNYIDWIAVRSIAATEPTNGEWSAEQEVTSYPLRITITPTSGTDPLSVTYNLSISDPLDNFTLTYGDGQEYNVASTTAFATTHIYNTPGTYTVWAEGYTEFATHRYYEIPYGVTVNAESVVASFSIDQTYNVVTFTNTSTGSPNEFYWLFGDGQASYEQNPIHTYHSAATHPVTLYASNQYQYHFATSNITITQLLVPPQAFFTPNEYNIISPSLPYSITFNNLSTPSFGCTYLWTIDGTTYTTEDVTHSFATHGFYDVSLTVSNLLGSDTKAYNDHIKLTRKGKTFYEVLGCTDNTNPFGVMVFPTEYMAATDTVIHANIFDENVKFVQSEIPETPGIDEWGYRNLYSTINEWGHRVIGTLTEWGHRIIHPASANDHGPLTKFRAEIFEETVVFSDEWQFGTE